MVQVHGFMGPDTQLGDSDKTKALASIWPSSCCWNLGNEPVDKKSASPFLSLALSTKYFLNKTLS